MNGEDLSPSAMKMAKAAQSAQATTAQELARAIMLQEGDAAVAKARLQAFRKAHC